MVARSTTPKKNPGTLGGLLNNIDVKSWGYIDKRDEEPSSQVLSVQSLFPRVVNSASYLLLPFLARKRSVQSNFTSVF